MSSLAETPASTAQTSWEPVTTSCVKQEVATMEAGGEYSLPTAHPAGTKIDTPFAIGTLIKNNPLLIAKFFPETNQNTASCSLISGPVLQVAGSVQHTVLSRDDQKSNRGRQIVPEIVLNLARNIRDALFRAMQFLVQFVIRY